MDGDNYKKMKQLEKENQELKLQVGGLSEAVKSLTQQLADLNRRFAETVEDLDKMRNFFCAEDAGSKYLHSL